ncbi:PQQ-dependent sugar dehydrogenase [Chelativorans sp. ZYF759]|uniref:PQQ-dependent sugar dehydrogenase n=1 Tax=Chelativorans sp. ZYF759 TaxID=2692213 RepID=UPI00145E7F83|nr:PQQ-dependent sugar dehydrogenase [Chelativorans sp. ZYF759]NMG39637.1 PQQ-dependent sugar dehydrogenase [Chelativorans sp. ZYF759]
MITKFATAVSTAAITVALAAPASAQVPDSVDTQAYQIGVETIVDGLAHPWALAFIDEDRFIVTERDTGHIRIGTVGGDLSDPLDGSPEVFRYEGETERSQSGLFDVKLHPEFDDNDYVYFSYSKPTERGAAVAIDRARLVFNGDQAGLEDVETIFEMQEDDQDSSGLHFGGRMAFDPDDNSIYLTIGDRRNISRAQDGADQAGSVLRMTDEGEPHPDGPFISADWVEEGEPNEYIFAMGKRNPQGIAFHPHTGELWLNEHGPEGGDEVNLIEAGQNYGWPYITAGEDYSGAPIGVGLDNEGMIGPFHFFEETVAPSGKAFVDGGPFEEWHGDMLIGGLVAQGFIRLTIADNAVQDEEWVEIGRRIRDVQVHPDGSIWLLTEHEDGEVLRLTPQG